MDAAPKQPGDDIGGYSVVEVLGSGGSGKVYRVEDSHGNTGALKLIDDPHDVSAVNRLRREVEALKALNHRAVPAVLDAEFDGDEKFVVYQFVEGPNLTHYVADHGPLSGDDLADFAQVLADALAAVHRIGVVHRDVTPSNVMMSKLGPMLIDFGLAQPVGDDRLTRTGLVSGTVGYVAPEVIDGHEPDEEADLWSWAAVVAFAGSGTGAFGRGKGALRRTMEGRTELPSIEGADELAAALSPTRESRPSPERVIAALRGESGGAEPYEHYAPGPSIDAARTREINLPAGPDGLPMIPETRRAMVGVWSAVIALGSALAPTIAMAVAVLLAWVGRAEHRRVASLAALRAKRPDKRGNEAIAAVGMPWHLLRALGELLPSLAMAAAGGAGFAILGWWLVDAGHVVVASGEAGVAWGHALALGIGALIALLLLWWGPWSDATRDGVRRGAYAMSRADGAGRGWVALGVIVAGSIVVAILLRVEPTFWPLPNLAP